MSLILEAIKNYTSIALARILDYNRLITAEFSSFPEADEIVKRMDENKFNMISSFPGVISEIRENLILISDLSVVNNYKNYLFKEAAKLTDNIKKQSVPENKSEIGNNRYVYKPPFFTAAQFRGFMHIEGDILISDVNVNRWVILDEIDKELNLRSGKKIKEDKPALRKFQWKATPAQLAVFIDVLIKRGFLAEFDRSGEGKARFLLDHIEIDQYDPSPGSLGKKFQDIENGINPISPSDKQAFEKLPDRKELTR